MTWTHAKAVPATFERLSEAAAAAVKGLLETKHLYQRVRVDPRVIVRHFEVLLTSAHSESLRRAFAPVIEVELTRFRGRLTRPNFGVEVAHEVEQESGTAGAALFQRRV
jgi:hypothetical protein